MAFLYGSHMGLPVWELPTWGCPLCDRRTVVAPTNLNPETDYAVNSVVAMVWVEQAKSYLRLPPLGFILKLMSAVFWAP